MKCPRCQHENPPGSNFCLGCGARLDATCGACGNDLPAGSRFCNKCSAPVSGESALPWDEAKTLYEWARMHQRRDRIGDREQAGSKLAAARELFERVGAARDVQKTLAADL